MCKHVNIYTHLHTIQISYIWVWPEIGVCRAPPLVTKLCRGPSVTNPRRKTPDSALWQKGRPGLFQARCFQAAAIYTCRIYVDVDRIFVLILMTMVMMSMTVNHDDDDDDDCDDDAAAVGDDDDHDGDHDICHHHHSLSFASS